MTTTERKWKYEIHSASLADTGDYTSCITFTNGIDILQTGGDEIEDEQCQQFCDLLNLMPDLWSHKLDAAEFELAQLKKESIASVIGKERQEYMQGYADGAADKQEEFQEAGYLKIDLNEVEDMVQYIANRKSKLYNNNTFDEWATKLRKAIGYTLDDLTPKDTTDGE